MPLRGIIVAAMITVIVALIWRKELYGYLKKHFSDLTTYEDTNNEKGE